MTELKGTTFKVVLNRNMFSKQDILRLPLKTRVRNQMVRILRWFGCRIDYGVQVLSTPVQKGNDWEYSVKLDTKKLIVFGLQVKETKIKSKKSQ